MYGRTNYCKPLCGTAPQLTRSLLSLTGLITILRARLLSPLDGLLTLRFVPDVEQFPADIGKVDQGAPSGLARRYDKVLT
jgi:hypothetical protein